jgi:hypothetical protein
VWLTFEVPGSVVPAFMPKLHRPGASPYGRYHWWADRQCLYALLVYWKTTLDRRIVAIRVNSMMTEEKNAHC